MAYIDSVNYLCHIRSSEIDFGYKCFKNSETRISVYFRVSKKKNWIKLEIKIKIRSCTFFNGFHHFELRNPSWISRNPAGFLADFLWISCGFLRFLETLILPSHYIIAFVCLTNAHKIWIFWSGTCYHTYKNSRIIH